jgi:hypothetical protein
METLPGALSIMGLDGGTAYVLFRKDRVEYVKGTELLKAYQLEEKSTTSRIVATCCNTAMSMRFEDAKHWVCIYRGRLQGDAPPFADLHKLAPKNAEIPKDIPFYDMLEGQQLTSLPRP